MRSLPIVQTQTALADLAEIWFGIAISNPAAATRVVTAIDQRIGQLSQFPEIGPLRPEIAPDLRSLVEGNYLILYRTSDNAIEIVRVLHGARDLSQIL